MSQLPRRITQALMVSIMFLSGHVVADAANLNVTSNTTLTTGTYSYDDVTVSNNAVLTLEGTVHITADNITVSSGSRISADKKGYAANSGPGAGAYVASGGSGAGHGGDGGRSGPLPAAGKYYGSATQPVTMGSGGGGTGCTINSVAVNSGGKGGGGIWLEVENTLTVSGTISANGGDGSEFLCDAQSGGGAGGSIYIVTDTFAGAGDIVAKGGKGGQTLLRGGGGGGGRIAIYYETSTFSGDVLATAGFGKTESGVSGSGHDGTVGFFDTDGNDFSAGHNWRFQFDDQPFAFDTITIDDGSQTTTEGTITMTGTQLIVDGNSTLIMSDLDELNINDVSVTGSSSIEGNLLLQANNLTIASGSDVSANGKGFTGERGVGAGLPGIGQGGGGGGYGGEGGTNVGGIEYGSPTAPVDLGSGGAGPGFSSGGVAYASSGGYGGGKIQLNISGTLTVNGDLTANGNNAFAQGSQAGGGSGGSIYVITEKFTGSGSITANGGNSGPTGGSGAGGGGAGGRIAIFHRQSETFSGTPVATGGSGVGENGDAGTVIVSQSVLAVSPDKGGDNGRVTTLISGSVFEDGATVKLSKSGESDIAGKFVSVQNNGVLLQATFELSGETQGDWDVTVDGPSGHSLTLNEAFTIEESKPRGLWVDVIGRNSLRPERPQTYLLAYGNTGNNDVYSGEFFIQIPNNADYKFLNWHDDFKDRAEDTTIQFIGTALPVNFVGTELFQIATLASSGTLDMCYSEWESSSKDSGYGDLTSRYEDSGEGNPEPSALDLSDEEEDLITYKKGSYERNEVSPNYYIHKFVIIDEEGNTETSVGIFEDGGVWVNVKNSNVVKIPFSDIQNGEATLAKTGGGTQVVEFEHQGSWRPEEPLKMRALGVKANQNINLIKNSITYCNPDPKVEDACANVLNPTSCTGFTTQVLYGEDIGGGQIGRNLPYKCYDSTGNESINSCSQEDFVNYLKNQIGEDDMTLNNELSDDEIDQSFKDRRDAGRDTCQDVHVASSQDPNSKFGPVGFGNNNYISAEQPMRYVIFFENIDTATAPAQEVIITDELDTAYLDISTFRLGVIGFGDTVITPPKRVTEYITEVDLRPGNDIILRLEAGLNNSTGVVTWKFTSLDPLTHAFTEDPDAGFLPPNDNPPEGDGFVTFTILPKDTVITGDEIENSASIVFDTNSPIETDTWLNTIDKTKPESSMNSMDSTGTLTSFDISWAGSDAHSGVKEYTLYVKENSGPFIEELTTTGTFTSFVGVNGSTYSFYTRAVDNVGNFEDTPETPDETITIEDPMQEPCTIRTDYIVGVTCFGTTTVTNNSQLEDYLTDYDYNGTNYKNLYINYSPTMENMDIHSPCEITIAANKTLTGERICIDGRKGVDTATGLTVNGTFVSFISELEEATIGGTSTIQANSLLIQAYKGADIHNSSQVDVDGPILIKSIGNTSTSWAKMGQSSTITAESVRLEAVREASTGTGMQLSVDNELEIISTGTESSSKALIGTSSDITAGSLEMSANKSVEVGNTSTLDIGEDASLTSTGSSSTSDVTIKLESVITADSLDMTAGDDAAMQTDSEVHITNNFHMQAATTNDCTISGSAVIDAGSESGNCL